LLCSNTKTSKRIRHYNSVGIRYLRCGDWRESWASVRRDFCHLVNTFHSTHAHYQRLEPTMSNIYLDSPNIYDVPLSIAPTQGELLPFVDSDTPGVSSALPRTALSCILESSNTSLSDPDGLGHAARKKRNGNFNQCSMRPRLCDIADGRSGKKQPIRTAYKPQSVAFHHPSLVCRFLKNPLPTKSWSLL